MEWLPCLNTQEFCALEGFREEPVNVLGTVKGCKTNVKSFHGALSAGLKSAAELTEGTNLFTWSSVSQVSSALLLLEIEM